MFYHIVFVYGWIHGNLMFTDLTKENQEKFYKNREVLATKICGFVSGALIFNTKDRLIGFASYSYSFNNPVCTMYITSKKFQIILLIFLCIYC
jgi:hypothetical protein